LQSVGDELFLGQAGERGDLVSPGLTPAGWHLGAGIPVQQVDSVEEVVDPADVLDQISV
jgi:hypothetical protein